METINDAAVLSDILGLLDAGSGRSPSCLEIAICLEDSLGIALTDDDIASLETEGPDGIRRLAGRKAAR